MFRAKSLDTIVTNEREKKWTLELYEDKKGVRELELNYHYPKCIHVCTILLHGPFG